MYAPSRSRHAQRRQLLWGLLVTVIALLTLTGPAQAETQITMQARADNGAFLPFARPPAKPAAMCLVDTGVNVNPDTEAAVVDRTAIDGGTGEDVSPTMHGTVLAMMAAAPANGWGMVGTAPGAIRIVSVRILEAGHTTFPFTAYASGITACLRVRTKYHIRVINLSLGTSEPPSSEAYEALANSVKEASDYGVAIVAAAGNDNGGPVDYPAAYPGVLAVGASNSETGQFCAFSNRGEGLALIAPGCDLNGADPLSGTPDQNYWQGTSEASAITSAALTALTSYKPELSWQQAEQDLTTAHDGVLDIAQTFRDAGLTSVVDAGEAAEPKPPATAPASTPTPAASSSPAPTAAPKPPQQLAPSDPMTLTGRFPKPHAHLRHRDRRELLLLSGPPSEAQAEVRYLGRRHLGRHHHRQHVRLLRTKRGTFRRLRLPARRLVKIRVRYIDPYDMERDGPWLTLRLPQDDRHRPHHRRGAHHRRARKIRDRRRRQGSR